MNTFEITSIIENVQNNFTTLNFYFNNNSSVWNVDYDR